MSIDRDNSGKPVLDTQAFSKAMAVYNKFRVLKAGSAQDLKTIQEMVRTKIKASHDLKSKGQYKSLSQFLGYDDNDPKSKTPQVCTALGPGRDGIIAWPEVWW